MESVTTKVLLLHDQGFTPVQIALELKISRERVRGIIRKSMDRGADSRRIMEIHEMMLEVLASVRELLSTRRNSKEAVAARMRTAEKQLPARLAAAADRLTELCPPGSDS